MKRLLPVLFFVAFLVQFAATSVFAQSVTPSAYNLPTRLDTNIPKDSGTHTQIVLIEVMAAVTCQLIGVDPVNPQRKCLGVDNQTGKIGFVQNGGGAVAALTSMITMTFNVPVHTHDFAAYTASNFGISKSAYAADTNGAGFNSLSPLLPVWASFRNVVYVLFVIFFMLIGIGIIFRFKLDGKTAMSIQSSIPRIIVTLILVTFSFAIVGLLIDVMYILMYLLFSIFNSIPGINLGSLNPTNIVGSTPYGAVGSFGGLGIAAHASKEFGSQLSAIFDGSAGNIVGGLIAGLIGSTLALVNPIAGIGLALGVFGLGSAGLGNEFIGVIGTIIMFLIFAIAMLAALTRLWFTLIKAYFFILVDVVVAPIWIAGSLIPGSPLTAGSWFRHIIKYIAVFPLTFAIFLLGNVLVQVFNNAPVGSTIFAPPFIGNAANPKNLGALMGFATILMSTEVVNMIQDIIKAPVNKYQAAIGQAVGVGTGIAGVPLSAGRGMLRGNVRTRTNAARRSGSRARYFAWSVLQNVVGK